MTQQNGNNESKNTTNTELEIQNDINKVNETLGKIETSVGLPLLIKAETLEKATELLLIDWSEYQNKTADQIMVDSCILTDYLISFQKVISREKSTIAYCKERMRKMIGHIMPEFKAYSYEERESLAIKEHPVAQQLFFKKIEAELHLTRLQDIYFSIKNLADRLENLAKVKLRDFTPQTPRT